MFWGQVKSTTGTSVDSYPAAEAEPEPVLSLRDYPPTGLIRSGRQRRGHFVHQRVIAAEFVKFDPARNSKRTG